MSALTPKQVAERYSVSTATVVHWIKRGELKAVNVGRSPRKLKPRWKILPEALERFEIGRTSGPPPERAVRRKRTSDVHEFIK